MGKIDLHNQKILVTGGNGYLGKFLVKALQNEGAEVFVVDKNIEASEHHFALDITDRNRVNTVVQQIQPDIVFHLAALLHRERNFDHFDLLDQVNHQGTFNLLMALKDLPYKNFIFTGTSEIYGDNKAPFTETQLPDPVSPYSLTKVYSENLIRTFSKLYQKNYTIVRLFNFYGENMPKQFFIPQLIHALQNQDHFDMTLGEQNRDFLYVKDVVNGLILAAKNTEYKQQTYNLCSGKAVSLRQLVETIKTQLDSHCVINFGALPYRKNEVWNMLGDNTKIKKQLGFAVKYSLEEGIKELGEREKERGKR
jgi:UDP-glucose 4-epimerase